MYSVSPSLFLPELSLTQQNLSTVLESMDDILWGQFSHCVNIPVSEQERIRRQYSSASERKQAVISLFISSHPARSWKLVANALYQLGSRTVVGDGSSCHRALNHLKKLFPTGLYKCRNVCIYLTHCHHHFRWSWIEYTIDVQWRRS